MFVALSSTNSYNKSRNLAVKETTGTAPPIVSSHKLIRPSHQLSTRVIHCERDTVIQKIHSRPSKTIQYCMKNFNINKKHMLQPISQHHCWNQTASPNRNRSGCNSSTHCRLLRDTRVLTGFARAGVLAHIPCSHTSSATNTRRVGPKAKVSAPHPANGVKHG